MTHSHSRPACQNCGKELPLKFAPMLWAKADVENWTGRIDLVLFCSKKCFKKAKA